MDITFNCKHCGQLLEIDEQGAGVSIDCPKCGKPAYVPSRPTTSSPQTPVRVAPIFPQPAVPSRVKQGKLPFLPPSIEGGLHCLVIATVLMIVGLVLFRMGLVASMICYALAIPFQVGALLCSVYGICKGSVKHGLALLAGVAVLCALIMLGPLWSLAKFHVSASPLMEEQQKMMEQMLGQH